MEFYVFINRLSLSFRRYKYILEYVRIYILKNFLKGLDIFDLDLFLSLVMKG